MIFKKSKAAQVWFFPPYLVLIGLVMSFLLEFFLYKNPIYSHSIIIKFIGIFLAIGAIFLFLKSVRIFNENDEATERLLEYSQKLHSKNGKKKKTLEWRNEPIKKRIEYSLIEGVDTFIDGFAERFFKLFFSLSVLIFTGSSPNAFKDFSIKLKKTWD